ncbi:MAG: sigma-70 family RNA polymerase sigma factor [Kiritimatiellae bacterium]|nr:sigma-70 family RNA polymerase sigma factor [Kiritimatiellia bacterium]
MTDIDLLNGYVTQAKAEYFNALVERYSGMIYAICLRMLGNRQDAQEVVQDTFVALAAKCHTIKSNVASWLHSTARNLSLKRIRHATVRTKLESSYGQEMQDTGTGLTRTREGSGTEIQAQIDEAMLELPAYERELLLRRYVAGHKLQEIADADGVSHVAVIKREKKAIGNLRQILQTRGFVYTVPILAAALAQGTAEAAPAVLVAALNQIGASAVAAAGGGGLAAGTGMGVGVRAWRLFSWLRSVPRVPLAVATGSAVAVVGLVTTLGTGDRPERGRAAPVPRQTAAPAVRQAPPLVPEAQTPAPIRPRSGELEPVQRQAEVRERARAREGEAAEARAGQEETDALTQQMRHRQRAGEGEGGEPSQGGEQHRYGQQAADAGADNGPVQAQNPLRKGQTAETSSPGMADAGPQPADGREQAQNRQRANAGEATEQGKNGQAAAGADTHQAAPGKPPVSTAARRPAPSAPQGGNAAGEPKNAAVEELGTQDRPLHLQAGSAPTPRPERADIPRIERAARPEAPEILRETVRIERQEQTRLTVEARPEILSASDRATLEATADRPGQYHGERPSGGGRNGR